MTFEEVLGITYPPPLRRSWCSACQAELILECEHCRGCESGPYCDDCLCVHESACGLFSQWLDNLSMEV